MIFKIPKLDVAYQQNSEITIQEHDSIESVEAAMYGLAPEEMVGGSIGCVDGEGNELEYSYEEHLKIVSEMGIYGFANQNTNTIHVWASKDAKLEDVIALFAHERGHLMAPSHKDLLKEETKAELYSLCAVYAYYAAKILMEKRR